MSLPPPLTALTDLDAQLGASGYAVLDAVSLARLAGVAPAAFAAWRPSWDELPPDGYLKDGGRYRRRRHACFVIEPGGRDATERLRRVEGRPHWQPVDYNALHGGIERWFEPMQPAMAADPHWAALLATLADLAGRLRGGGGGMGSADGATSATSATSAGSAGSAGSAEPWYCEAHPFRIDTTDGIGRPTPEGAHRDGVDLVAVVLVGRHQVKGGETRVFDARGPQGMRFTLSEPWSVLLLDDERVIHETTPIQPLKADAPGHRDTLVLTFRRHGFQGPA